MRSRYVARTPPVEARSAGRRSSVQLRTLPVTRRSPASSARTHRRAFALYVVISRDGRKLVIRFSNATRALIANPPNTAQLGGHPLPLLQVTSGSMQYCRHAAADRHTHTHIDTQTQTRVTTIHFASSTTHAKCNQSSDIYHISI